MRIVDNLDECVRMEMDCGESLTHTADISTENGSIREYNRPNIVTFNGNKYFSTVAL